MDLDASRIAVLDVNHGGLVLAEELRLLGYDVVAVDVYGAGKKSEAGVPVVRQDEAGGRDLLVAPVHAAPDRLIAEAIRRKVPVVTHHRLAGWLAAETKRLRGARCVEVTGTYGKTTTCTLLSKMLQAAGEHVLLHASTGLFFDGRQIGSRLSITPANILQALDRACDAGVSPTVCLFEVSLGGCGLADVGTITTLDRDYPIAGGTKRSYQAKMQLVEYAKPGSALVHPASFGLTRELEEITFGAGGDLYFDSGLLKGRLLEGAEIDPRFDGGLDLDSYADPGLAAAATALKLGAKPEAIKEALQGFAGIPGRMKREWLEGRVLIDNSCSGLTVAGVLHALEKGREGPGRKVLVLGEERYNVCEGLDPLQAAGIVRNWTGDAVLVGERLRSAGGLYAAGLEEGIRLALSLTAPGDTIISCVKTWR